MNKDTKNNEVDEVGEFLSKLLNGIKEVLAHDPSKDCPGTPENFRGVFFGYDEQVARDSIMKQFGIDPYPEPENDADEYYYAKDAHKQDFIDEMHKNATELEEKATVGYSVNNDPRELYKLIELASSLRVAANYMDGVSGT